jgi:hypothetical protein
MMFPHDEYHIYTTDDRLQKQYVHLERDVLDEAAALSNHDHGVSGEWKHVHRIEVAPNVKLAVKPGQSWYPRLESKGYEGWMPVDDGKLEEQVHFDSMLFHKCIADYRSEPEWSFDETKEWVQVGHRDMFENEFMEYLAENYDQDEVVVDW